MNKAVGCRLLVAAATVLLGAAPVCLAASGGNDLYTVSVEDWAAGAGLGVYTAQTGLSHPVTGARGTQNVLVGNGIPGTSFTTIRSWTSGTDYVQRNGLTLASTAPPTLELEPFVAAGEEAIPVGDPASPSGFTTIYRPGVTAAAPDNLIIRQTVEAVGTTFDDSAVLVETEIINNGTTTVAVGVRYLWDLTIGPNDDGPAFKALDPDGSRTAFASDYLDPQFGEMEATDNNDSGACFGLGNSPSPYYSVQGSVTGPAWLGPLGPSRLAYISWPSVSGLPGKLGGAIAAPSAFDFVVGGGDIGTCLATADDTGVAYWWGDSQATAAVLAPGESVAVGAFLYAYMPGSPPAFPNPTPEGPWDDPSCQDQVDNDLDGFTDLDDPDCTPPAPEVEGPYGDLSCQDQVDNDLDGLVDADDPDCAEPEPQYEGPASDPTCSDGMDNDGDGMVDMDDSDCAGAVNQPPACAGASASTSSLWPVNHRLVDVSIQGVSDPDGDAVAVTVTSVMQDEPVTGTGDGNTCPDAGFADDGSVLLRAERSGQGDGRVYHLLFTADDGAGGQCSGEVTVCVSADRGRRGSCVDQGALYDAMGACGPKARGTSRRNRP